MAGVVGLAVGSGLVMGGAERLGPPGICRPIEVGGLASRVDEAWRGVDKSNLVEKLPGVLDRFSGEALARMEILRRASFTQTDERMGNAVVAALALRALEADADGKGGGSALFDVGYMVHLYRALDVDVASAGERDGIAGYAFVSRAIERGGGDAAMHVGAAYMTLPAMVPDKDGLREKARVLFDGHVAAGLRACVPGSAEEKNIEAVLAVEGKALKDARMRLSAKKER